MGKRETVDEHAPAHFFPLPLKWILGKKDKKKKFLKKMCHLDAQSSLGKKVLLRSGIATKWASHRPKQDFLRTK